MDAKIVSDYEHLFYDPYLYGYDDDFFKKITGNIACIDGKIRIVAGRMSTTTMMMFGNLILKTTVPAEPTAGDSRIWGLYSRAYGNRNAR